VKPRSVPPGKRRAALIVATWEYVGGPRTPWDHPLSQAARWAAQALQFGAQGASHGAAAALQHAEEALGGDTAARYWVTWFRGHLAGPEGPGRTAPDTGWRKASRGVWR
jgi:hypothetical protein